MIVRKNLNLLKYVLSWDFYIPLGCNAESIGGILDIIQEVSFLKH
jgi:hypothetical protein